MKHKTKILFLITLITLLLTLTSINATDNTTEDNTQDQIIIENHNEITKDTTTPQISDKKDDKIKQNKENEKEIKQTHEKIQQNTTTSNLTKTLQTNKDNKKVKQDSFETSVRGYSQLYNKITDIKNSYYSYYTDTAIINLYKGDYYVTDPLYWGNTKSNIKTLIINGNNNIIDADYYTNFISVETGYKLELHNFKIKKAYGYKGSVIYNKGTVNIYNSKFEDCYAESTGSVLYNKGTVNIYDSLFTECDSYDNGGVIYNDQGTIKIKNGTFTNNYAYYSNGGVIYNNNGKLNITNSYFSFNSATRGGAIYTTGLTNITSTTMKNNQANNGGNGGAIYNDKKTTTITNSKLLSNKANNGGAIYNNKPAKLNIYTSQFDQNTAYNNGGANTNYGTLYIKSSNFNNNTATRGGVNYNYNKTTIIKSTLQTNKATENGGAIYNDKGLTQITDSTLQQNQAKRAASLYNNQGTFTINTTKFIDNKANNDADDIINYGDNCHLINNQFKQEKYNNTNLILTTKQIKGQNNTIQLTKTNKIKTWKIITIKSPIKDQSQKNTKISFYDGSYFINSTPIDNNGIAQTKYQFISNGTKILNIKYNQHNITIKQEVIKPSIPTYGAYNNEQLISSINQIKKEPKSNYAVVKIQSPIKLNQSINWGNSNIKTLKIYANNNLFDALNKTQFITVEKGYTLELYNFKIRYANAQRGAVIYNKGTVNIYDSIFLNNTAKVNGGVIYNDQGQLKILNSSFSNNKADNGAIIYNNKGTTNITKSYISFNNATRGAVNYNTGDLNITNTTIKNNKAKLGGVNYNDKNSTIIIRKSDIYNNKATQNGGVNYNDKGYIELFYSTLNSNNAINNGGCNYNNKGIIYAYYSNLNNNNATRGGANYNNGRLTISYSEYYNNHAINGGCNYNDKGEIDIFNSTLSSNDAINNGGCNYNNKGKIGIESSTLNYNKATRGGVNYNTGDIKVTDSNFRYNNANGGVNYNDKGYINIDDIYSVSNYALRAADTYNNNGNLVINYSLFQDNNAQYEGIILINYGGNVILEFNEFYQYYNNEVLVLTDKHIDGADNEFQLDAKYSVEELKTVNYKSPVKDLRQTIEDTEYYFHVDGVVYNYEAKRLNHRIEANHQFTQYGERIRVVFYTGYDFYTAYIYQKVTPRPIQTIYDVYSFNDFTNALSKIKQINADKECTINIYSDFKITKLSLWADANKVRNLTINGNNHIIDGQNKYKFMSIKPGYRLDVNDIIIQNCNSVSYDYPENRGGVFSNKGKLNLENTELKNSKANVGGAVYNDGTMVIEKSKFTNNNALIGGAIDNENSIYVYNTVFSKNVGENSGGAILTETSNGYSCLDHCTFKENWASNGAATAIFDGGLQTSKYSTYSNNKGEYCGGAIYVLRSSLYVQGSTFTNNKLDLLKGAESIGGAICVENYENSDYYVIIDSSKFENNYAEFGGAVYIANCSEGKINNSIFNSNKAEEGAAIDIEDSILNMTNCNFTKNNATQHATVSNVDSNTHITSCNFNQNYGVLSSGVFNSQYGKAYIYYSTFTRNKNALYGTVYNYGYVDVDHCDFTYNTESGDSTICNMDDGEGYVWYCNFTGPYESIGNYGYYTLKTKENYFSK